MTEQLTAEQTIRLRQAIDRAMVPGGCQYIKRNHRAPANSVPICVIGQLASLEGIPNQVIYGWMGTIDTILCEPMRYSAQNLTLYPRHLLVRLQQCWDGLNASQGKKPPEVKQATKQGRIAMYEILDRWISDHPHNESL